MAKKEKPASRYCLRSRANNFQQGSNESDEVVVISVQPPSSGTEQKLMELFHIEVKDAAGREIEVENSETEESDGPRVEDAMNEKKTAPLETYGDELILSEDDLNENIDIENVDETEKNYKSDEQTTILSDVNDINDPLEIEWNLEDIGERERKKPRSASESIGRVGAASSGQGVWERFNEEVKKVAETIENVEENQKDDVDEPEYKLFSLIPSNSQIKDMKGKEIVLSDTATFIRNNSESDGKNRALASDDSPRKKKVIRTNKESKTVGRQLPLLHSAGDKDFNSNSPASVSKKRSLTQSTIYEVSVPISNDILCLPQGSCRDLQTIPRESIPEVHRSEEISFPPVTLKSAGEIAPGPPVPSRRMAPPLPSRRMAPPVPSRRMAPPGPQLKNKKSSPVLPRGSGKLVPDPPINARGGFHMSQTGNMTTQPSSAPTPTPRDCFTGRLAGGPVSARNLANTMGSWLLPHYPSPPSSRSRILLQSELRGEVDQVDKEQKRKVGEAEKMQVEEEVVDLTQEL